MDVYGTFLRAFQPRVIKTNEELEVVLQQIVVLTENPSTEAQEILQLLRVLVCEYNTQKLKDIDSPVEALKYLMKRNNLQPKDLLDVYKSRGQLSWVLSGKRTISKTKAKELAAKFNVSPVVFI